MTALLRVLLVAMLAAGLNPSLAHAEDKPNLVVFISDDHGYLDSSVAGSPDLGTPHLTRLAKDGMTFTRAFAASPSCAPSRAAMLTGLMPNRNGSMINHQPPRADVKKLPAYLHELGYEVVAFGKVAHYRQGEQYGFDLVKHDTFHDDQCVTAALEYLRHRTSDKPLCLMVGTNWPHVPWPEAPEDDKLAEITLPPTHVDTPATRRWRARYYAAVERFDADLGAVYDAAYEQLGDNTLFIHFSDHGAQWPFGKWNLYDAGIRVPFFAVWPSVIEPGSRSEAMLSLVDLLPTLVEAAGGSAPEAIDGRSIVHLLGSPGSPHRDNIFTTHSGDGRMNEYPMRSVRTERWKYIRNLRPEGEHHSHIDRGKPVDGNHYWSSWAKKAKLDPTAAAIVEHYFHRPTEELYDLQADPHEQNNLAGNPEQAETLARLRGDLDRWMDRQGDQGLATERAAAEALQRTKGE